MTTTKSYKGVVEREIMNNPATKVPLTLLLDVSYSMVPREGVSYQDSRIRQVKDALHNIVTELRSIDDGVSAPVLRVIFFGTTDGKDSHDNFHATNFYDPDDFDVEEHWNDMGEGMTMGGSTPLGEAMVDAINGYNEGLRRECRENSTRIYAPWFITISDGDSNGDADVLKEATSLVARASEHANFQFLVVAVDDASLRDKLKMFSPRADVISANKIDIPSILKTITDTFSSIPADFSPDEVVAHDKELADAVNNDDDDDVDDISDHLNLV